MATISGELIFSITRNNQTDSNSYGIGNIPMILQNTTSNEMLGVFTQADGTYTFTQVPNGSYRIVVVYEYKGTTLNSPAAFTSTNTEVGDIPSAKLPPYTVLTGNYPSEITNLSAITPTTVFVTISNDEDVTAATVFLGPTRYESINLLLDSSATLSPINLLTDVDDGTFGDEPPGTQPNGGPSTNPYPGINTSFTFVPQYDEIHDGDYSIGNTISPYPQFLWWRLSDRTTGIETGRMEIVNGDFSGQSFLNLRENVEPFTDYVFSSWLVNLDNSTSQEAPKFGIEITGESSTNVLYNKSLEDYFSPTQGVLPIWKEIGTAFNTGDNSSVGLVFYSLGDASPGNDYAVDDTKLRLITYPVISPTKEVNKTYAVLGEIVTYTITINNTNENELIDVSLLDEITVNDTISNNLEFVTGSVTVNGTSYPNANPTDGFEIPDVEGKSTTTITFEVKVISIPSNPTIDDVATLNYEYTPITGGIPNSFSKKSNIVPLYVGKAIIGGEEEPNTSFTKTVNKEYAQVGDILTYTIVAENIGNVEASNVVITDTIPEGTTYVENSISSNVSFTGSPLTTINLTNPLLPSDKATITYEVKVDEIPSTNPIPNTAKVTYNYTENPDDVNGATGSGTTNTVDTFIVNSSISIVKSENITAAIVGNIVTYTLFVKNTGNINCTNVIVTDNLQPELTFVENSLTINNKVSNENISSGVYLGTLDIGQQVTITFRAKVNSQPPTNVIENNAKVQYTVVTDSTSTNYNEISNTVEIQVYTPSLIITKTSSSENVYIGDVFTYTINVKNTGDANISNIIISDSLPYQFKITNIEINNKNANTIQLNGLNIGSLEPNASDNIVVTILVVSNTLSDFQNTVLAKGTVQVNNANPPTDVMSSATSSQSVTTIQPVPNISIVKSENITQALVGNRVEYTLEVENVGNINCQNVVVTDELQSDLTFVEGSLIVNNQQSTDNISSGISLGSLDIGQKATITFEAEVNAVPPGNIINNNAKVEYTITTDSTNESHNQTSNTVEVNVYNPSLEVTKITSAETVYVGEEFSYAINIKNTSEVTVSNITISDSLPSQFRIVKIEINNENSNTTVLDGLNIGSLEPDESDNIIVTILVVSNTLSDFQNTVLAKGTAQVNNTNPPTEVTSSATSNQSVTTLQPAPSISIVKSENITQALVGNIVTYTLEVENTGNINCQNVVVTDELQSDLTFVEGSLIVNNQPSTDNISSGISIGTLEIGEKVIITFKAEVNAIPPGNIINNNANVQYTVVTDSSSTNYNGTSNTVQIQVDTPSLEVTKTSSSENVYVGNEFTYTINVKNTGEVAISNVIILDSLPYQFKITQIEVNNKNANTTQLDNLNIGSLEPNESDNIVVTILVVSNTLLDFKNIVYVRGTAQVNSANSPTDVTSSTTSSQSVTTIQPAPNISIVKSENITQALVGNIVTYTLEIENVGNINCQNVVVTDELQSQLTFIEGSLTINNQSSNENISSGVSVGNLQVGETVTITFKAEVNAIPPENIINNNAKVEYTITTDSTSENYNQTSNTVQINVYNPSLEITKIASAETVYVGEEFTYTINIENKEEVTVSNIIISDNLPPQFKITKIEINNANINTTVLDGLNIGNLEPGESDNIVVTILVLSNTLSNFQNTVLAEGTAQVNNANPPTNITSSATSSQSVTTIQPDPNISIVKSENITKALVGNIVTYTLEVENTGNINCKNVVVTDELQPQLTFVEGSLTINNQVSNENISSGIPLGNLEIGEKVSITFKAEVNDIPPGNIINNNAKLQYTLVINSESTNYNQTSNTVQINVYNPSLEVTKTASAETVYVGEEFTYTINIENTSQVTVSNIIILDSLPSQFKITKIEINNEDTNTTELDGLNIGNLEPGESDNIVVTILVLENTLSNFENLVSVKGTSQVNDVNPPTNITSSATSNQSVTTLQPVPNISIVKSEDVDTVLVGGPINYTLVVKNTGNVNLSNVIISDDLSQQLTFVEGSLTINGIQTTENIINGVNIGDLDINNETIIRFEVIVNSIFPSTTITNIANATYNVNFTNNKTYTQQSNIVKALIEIPKILVTKISNKQYVYVGDIFTYTITVKNPGDTIISNVILNDNLPKQFTIVNININGKDSKSTQLDGLNLGTLNINETIIIVVTIKMTENNLTNFKNIVEVAGITQANPINPPEIVRGIASDPQYVNSINPITTLSVEKAESTNIAKPCQIVTYTLTIKNTGNIPYSNLLVIDKLSPKLTFIQNSLIINGKQSSQNISTGIKIETLNVGETVIIKFNVIVNNIWDNFKIQNNATVLYSVELYDEIINLYSISNTVYLEVERGCL